MRIALVVLFAVACGSPTEKTGASSGATSASATAPSSSATTMGSGSIAPTSSASAATSASAAADAALPGETTGCETGMVLVKGSYCPSVIEKCDKHHKEYETSKGNKNVSERCLKYESPTKCHPKSTRLDLAFCMDRYEYPNVVGEIPRVLTDWYDAKKRCAEQGKRLCTEREFNFACEGPEMLPYVYGYERSATKCSIDKPYVRPNHRKQMKTYDACLGDEYCKGELARLDQREPIGSRKECVSWAGIFDLNGNVNEWVELPGKDPPNRSGLKGGWWGPVRSRCRPTVGFHKESDYGYEVGFRCCADAK